MIGPLVVPVTPLNGVPYRVVPTCPPYLGHGAAVGHGICRNYKSFFGVEDGGWGLTDYQTNLCYLTIILYRLDQGRSHVSKMGGVHLSFLSVQMSNYNGQRRRGRGMGWGLPHSFPLHGSGGVVSSRAGSGPEPQPQTVLRRFMCNFVRFHAF